MEKRNKIILIIIIALTTIVVSFCIYSILSDNISETDADKFRNEYMSLNDVMIGDTETTYLNISISETNTVEYREINEVLELLDNGNGIIFFGNAKNSESRNIAPLITSIAEKEKVKVYYIDITDLYSKYKVNNDGIEKTKEGSKEYYDILTKLDDYLSEYTLKDQDENVYETGEKRLITPSIVALKDGVVTDFHEGLLDDFDEKNSTINNKQEKEIKSILEKLVKSTFKNDSCSKDDGC